MTNELYFFLAIFENRILKENHYKVYHSTRPCNNLNYVKSILEIDERTDNSENVFCVNIYQLEENTHGVKTIDLEEVFLEINELLDKYIESNLKYLSTKTKLKILKDIDNLVEATRAGMDDYEPEERDDSIYYG